MKTTNPNSSSKDNKFEREQYLYVTTRGRKSGRPREIEIWFTHLDGRFFVIAEYPTSHWVENLRANAEAQVRVAGNSFAVRARLIPAETEGKLIQTVAGLSRAKYGWGDGVVIELCPGAPIAT